MPGSAPTIAEIADSLGDSPETAIIRMDDWYDAWGAATLQVFGICEALHHAGEVIPPEWEFRHSDVNISGCPNDQWPDSEYLDGLLSGEYTADALRRIGYVLIRYRDDLRAAGLDY